MDLESILIPEIWITIAKNTHIQELYLTTRDVPNYEVLMDKRLKILRTHNLKLKDVQKIVKNIEPYEGAVEFLSWLRKKSQTIILSDSFYEFVNPIMKKLFYPTIFCNSLEIDEAGFIKKYRLRQKNGKYKSIKSLKSLGFKIIAIGDSYNDVDMLKEADIGIFFRPSDNVLREYNQFLVTQNYSELKSKLRSAREELANFN
jgi:phosphoserine/homoserine phosphotransferase